MDHKSHPQRMPSLKKPITYSVIIHTIIFVSLSVAPGIRLPFNEKPTRVIWVELPKGTSEEIGLGLKKSESLPKSTIEEQKKLFQTEQKPLAPEMKAPAQQAQKPQEKMKEPAKAAAKAPPRKAASSTDRKIANALAMIDKQLANRTIVPEAGQIKESGEGYKYGTGNKPLRVLPSDPEYLKYQAMVRARIISEWVLPLRYIEEGGQRRNCAVDVMINMDGDVISTQWERTSGDPTFDQSALRAVRKASPFPKPPDRLAWEAYNEGFLIEFDPRLKPQ
jgi:colicin import membrane protein